MNHYTYIYSICCTLFKGYSYDIEMSYGAIALFEDFDVALSLVKIIRSK